MDPNIARLLIELVVVAIAAAIVVAWFTRKSSTDQATFKSLQQREMEAFRAEWEAERRELEVANREHLIDAKS